VDKITEAVDAVPLAKGWRDQPDTVPQHKYDRLIVDEYAPRIVDALNRILEKSPVVDSIRATRNSFQKATPNNADFEEDVDDFGEEVPYGGATSGGAAKIERKSMAAEIATSLAIAAGTAILSEVIRAIYLDAITSAAFAASEQTGRPLNTTTEFGVYTTTLDFADWTPGSSRTAEFIRGDAFSALLDSAGITLASVDQRTEDIYQTTLNAMGNRIADGIQQGLSVYQIGATLREYVSDPRRADMIAHTETSRAMHAATISTYKTNGIELMDYLAESDACEECEMLAEGSPYNVDDLALADLPIHPNCRCALEPNMDALLGVESEASTVDDGVDLGAPVEVTEDGVDEQG
jgi:SPP1 gp7 family putative phage head morphogenesis protein